jgi:dCMP deaminase
VLFRSTYINDKLTEIKSRYALKTKPEVLHAETNAISKLAKSNEAGDNATMFCTHAPCIDCAKLIYQSGINNVYYRDTYRDDSGLKFLEKSNVSVTKYTIQD